MSDEQAAAARALATDGHGVSVLQALAGTGKTRVLGALARIYEVAGFHVVGVAPTGCAARGLGDAAEVAAFTIHRLSRSLTGVVDSVRRPSCCSTKLVRRQPAPPPRCSPAPGVPASR
ncbi:MAG: AAA family ATPase [Solirubrobacterales bacterium]|nr:AAA family ATPase [Solirubrobacterales bacterium]